MDRSNIVAFNSRIAEAGGILEEANRREIERIEASTAHVEEMLIELRVRHSQLLTYIRECWAEQERVTNETMAGTIKFLEGIRTDYDRRLAELRETPAPKLIVSE